MLASRGFWRVDGVRIVAIAMTAVQLMMGRAAFAQQATQPAAAADAIPSAQEVIAASMNALGGQAAIDKIKSVRGMMRMRVDNNDILMESWWSRSGGRKSTFVMPGGEMVMISDGTLAWMQLPSGFALLTDEQSEELRNQACMFMNVLDPVGRFKETGATVINMGQQQFGGVECWRLHAPRPNGRETDVFYNIATGMPVGIELTATIANSQVWARSLFSDWWEQEGVKFFRTLKIETSAAPGTIQTIQVTAVEINRIDDAVFVAPEDVKKQASQARVASHDREVTYADLTPDQATKARDILKTVIETGDLSKMKLAVQQMEPTLIITAPEDKNYIRLIVQELKKEIAKRGG